MNNTELTPLQNLYKEAADTGHIIDKRIMAFSDMAVDRLIKILKSKESYQGIDQSTIDKGVNFIQAYMNVFTYDGEKTKSFYCFWKYDEAIRYCYLDGGAAFESKGKVSEHLTRMSYIQKHEPFENLTFDAKQELSSLLLMWKDITALRNEDFLFRTKESNTSKLPNTLSLSSLKWNEDYNIEPHEWERVQRA